MLTRIIIVAAVFGSIASVASAAAAPKPYVNGAYVTQEGAAFIEFVPIAANSYGYFGLFTVDGVDYIGDLFPGPKSADYVMVWYYPTGEKAGTAIVVSDTKGSYAGPIAFTDKQGHVTSLGITLVKITEK